MLHRARSSIPKNGEGKAAFMHRDVRFRNNGEASGIGTTSGPWARRLMTCQSHGPQSSAGVLSLSKRLQFGGGAGSLAAHGSASSLLQTREAPSAVGQSPAGPGPWAARHPTVGAGCSRGAHFPGTATHKGVWAAGRGRRPRDQRAAARGQGVRACVRACAMHDNGKPLQS